MKILIADDNELALEMLRATLTEFGHTVHAAADGRRALEIMRQGECRLLVTDWEMPGLSGLDLCRIIRAEALPAYTYIILLTGRGTVQERVEGLSAGADDFIAKPFDPAELIARVRAGERVLSLETRDIAIFAMARLAESRDPETGAHLERVRSYCRALAQHLAGMPRFSDQVNGEFIRLIYLTSPLHDIGKVGIPDSVLLKPARLSDREFEIMKTHAAIGAQTLEAALQVFPGVNFLEMARDIALTHHERFDGSGYPAGLVGEQIPLAGRIVALADVYDALTSRRVYKSALHHEVVRSMILEENGAHFDPAIVEAFLACEAQFTAIRERFSEPQSAAA